MRDDATRTCHAPSFQTGVLHFFTAKAVLILDVENIYQLTAAKFIGLGHVSLKTDVMMGTSELGAVRRTTLAPVSS